MNKLVKGSIAGAAGIALLLGGLGSFALWNDTTTVQAGAVRSGELEIVEPATPGVWKFANNTALTASSRIVPGDTVTYATTFTVDAKGDNLHATLTDNVTALTSTINGATATSTYTVTGTGATQDPNNAHLYTFDAGTYTVNVEITVAFATTTDGLTGQDQTFTPGAVTVALNQVIDLPVAE